MILRSPAMAQLSLVRTTFSAVRHTDELQHGFQPRRVDVMQELQPVERLTVQQVGSQQRHVILRHVLAQAKDSCRKP
jgi:hypothetical protein